jgi:hypothetical protein
VHSEYPVVRAHPGGGVERLPYVIDEFAYVGQVSPEAFLAADDFLSGTFLPIPLPTAQPRTEELPLLLAIIDFPE